MQSGHVIIWGQLEAVQYLKIPTFGGGSTGFCSVPFLIASESRHRKPPLNLNSHTLRSILALDLVNLLLTCFIPALRSLFLPSERTWAINHPNKFYGNFLVKLMLCCTFHIWATRQGGMKNWLGKFSLTWERHKGFITALYNIWFRAEVQY